MKRAIIIIVLLIIIAALAVAGFYLWKDRKETDRGPIMTQEEADAAQVNASLFQVTTLQALVSEDPTKCDSLESDKSRVACQDKAFGSLAVSSGDAANCLKASRQDDADLCVYQVATAAGDSAACDLIVSEKSRKSCQERIVGAKAREEAEADSCLGITNEFSRKDCLISVFADFDSAGGCDTIDDSVREFCQGVLAVRARYIQDDKSLCVPIADEGLRGYCDGSQEYFINFIRKFDKDGDGLALWQEEIIGSSDANADSDGDGYDDHTELVNGYSLLGEEKYEEEEYAELLQSIDF